MRAPSTIVSGGRESARASLFIAFFFALAICGGIVGYFFLIQTPVPRVEPAPRLESAVETPIAGVKEQPEPPPTASPPASVDAKPVSPAAAESKSEAPVLRVFGTVKDAAGQPIALLCVRWVPASQEDLRPWSHDPTVLGKDADPALLPEGELRDALSRSLVTSTGDAGGYELRVPLSEMQGVVVVSGAGREMKVRDVARESPGAAAPAAVAAVAAVAEAPKAAESPKAAETPASPVAPTVSSAPPAEPSKKVASSKDVEINFTLDLAGSISGKVTDKATGEPAPGMAVVAGTIDSDAPAMLSFVKPDAPSAVVGPDGKYSLQGLRPGEYRVVPRTGKSEYVSLSSRMGAKVALEGQVDLTDVDFQVNRGGWIHGRVTGPDRKPVKDVRCSVMPTDFMSASMKGDIESMTLLDQQKSRSDAEGYFELRGLPPGKTYRVSGSQKGYAPSKSEPVEITDDRLEAEVRLSLARGCTISGHAVTKDGRPAAKIEVAIIPDMGEMMAGNIDAVRGMESHDVTDDNGAFILRDLPAGEFNLHAGKVKPENFFGGKSKTTPVLVDGTRDVAGIRLVVDEGEEGTADIAGVVLDERGNPLEEASLQVSSAQDFTKTSASTATTGPDGRFSAAKLSGGVFHVAASKAGYASATLKGVAANTRDLRITLNRHGRVSGNIVASDGAPFGAGGKVKVKPVEEKESIQSTIERLASLGGKQDSGAPVNEDGTFSVEAPPGSVDVLASVPGFAPGRSGPITVFAGEDHAGVEIRVSAGAVLQGRVTLGGNRGVEGAAVSVKPAKGDALLDLYGEMMPQIFGKEGSGVVTDDQGYYEVRHLAAGEYALTASHPDYAPSEPVAVSLEVDQVWKVPALELSAGGAVNGRVLEGEKAKPGMMVQMIGAGPIQQAFTDTTGQFRFKGLKPGDYLLNIMDVAAMQKGKMVMKSRTLTLGREEEKAVEVVFGTGHRVFGTIKGLPPAPMRMITMRRPGGPAPEKLSPLDMKSAVEAGKYQAGIAMVTPEDKYEIPDIEPGAYLIEVAKMPDDPTDMAAYEKMDRTPHYRKEITVEKKDLEHDIEIK